MPVWLLATAALAVLGIGLVDDTTRRASGAAKTLAPALIFGSLAALIWAWKR